MLRSLLHRQGQVAFEFVLLVAILFMMNVIFVGVALENTTDLGDENEYLHVVDLGRAIQSELYMASSVGNGYSRRVILPEKLDSRYGYNITILNQTLLVTSDNHEYSLTIPEINGTISVGNNTVNKSRDMIHVTQN